MRAAAHRNEPCLNARAYMIFAAGQAAKLACTVAPWPISQDTACLFVLLVDLG